MGLIAVYQSDGHLSIIYPSDESAAGLPDFAASAVPSGAPWAILDFSALPDSQDFREAWVLDLSDPDSPAVVEDPDKKAAILRSQALEALEDWFREMTEPGFETNDGIRLGMQTEDVTLLTGHYVLAKEAAALGMTIPPLIDADGVPHEFEEIEELTAIMLAYGQRRAEISSEYAAKKAAILSGET